MTQANPGLGDAATTASTAAAQKVDLEAMADVARVLKALPPGEWVLMDPQGRTWISPDPADLLKVLMPHHPLMKGIM